MAMSGRNIKEKLISEYGLVCMYCGTKVVHPGELERDHIWPSMLGGDYVYINLALACRHCQRAKGFFTPQEFKEWLQRFCALPIKFHPHVEERLKILLKEKGMVENYGFHPAKLIPVKKP